MAEKNRSIEEATSLKQLFQGITPEKIALCEGVVVGASPLKVQVANNLKMVAYGETLAVAKHLTDYTTACTISGGILSATTSSDNAHTHTNPEGGDTGAADAHSHTLSSFSVTGASITIHNALKVGDRVYMLRLNGGKRYYVLDRVGD